MTGTADAARAIAPHLAPHAVVLSLQNGVDNLAQIRAAASLFEEVSRGERPAVAIILPMLPEAHIAGWGASSVGVACQINPFLEMKQIVAIMNAARATTLVTTTSANGRGAWDKLGEVTAAVPTLRRIFIVGGGDPASDFDAALAAQAAKGSPFTPVTDPEAEATYLPTGGTRSCHGDGVVGSDRADPRGILCDALADRRRAAHRLFGSASTTRASSRSFHIARHPCRRRRRSE